MRATTKSWKSVRGVSERALVATRLPPGTPPVKSAGKVARYAGGEPAEAAEKRRQRSTVLRSFTCAALWRRRLVAKRFDSKLCPATHSQFAEYAV